MAILSCDSAAIFEQLGDLAGPMGVKSVIENHDAWLHGAAAAGLAEAVRMHCRQHPMMAAQERQVRANRKALAGLVTCVPVRMSCAG